MKSRENVTVQRLNELFEYNPDTGELTWRVAHGRNPEGGKVFKVTRFKNKQIYVNVDNVRIPARAVCWAVYHGYWPKGRLFAYNSDPCDNRIDNIVLGAPSQHKELAYFATKEPEVVAPPDWVREYLRYDGADGSLWWVKNPAGSEGFEGTVFDHMTNMGGYIKGGCVREAHVHQPCVLVLALRGVA